MATLTLDRTKAIHTDAGERVTGEIIATGRRISGIIATDRLGRDGLRLDVDAARYRRQRLPLIVGHDLKSLPVGYVHELRVDQRNGYRALVGTFVFSRSARAQEIEADVRAGIITDISIGFDVEKGQRDYRTGRAVPTINEVSLVPVAADSETVVVERSWRPSFTTRSFLFDDSATVATAVADRLLRSLEVSMPHPGARPASAYERSIERYRAEVVRAVEEGRPLPDPPQHPAVASYMRSYERRIAAREAAGHPVPVMPWAPLSDPLPPPASPVPDIEIGCDPHARAARLIRLCDEQQTQRRRQKARIDRALADYESAIRVRGYVRATQQEDPAASRPSFRRAW